MRAAPSISLCPLLLSLACAAGPGAPDGGDPGDGGNLPSGFPTDVLAASGLAVDDTEVFFGRSGGGGIDLYAIGVDGTNPRLLGFGASESVRSLTLQGDALFYVNRISGANRAVSTFPRAGGAYSNLTDSLYLADAVAADATHVYVAHYGSSAAPKFTISRRLRTAATNALDVVAEHDTPAGGNVPTLLVGGGRVYANVANDPNLYAASLPGPGAMLVMGVTEGRPAIDVGVTGLALGGGKLFMGALNDLTNQTFSIQAVDTTGGSLQAIVTGRAAITDVAADASRVYWLESEDDTTSMGAIFSAAHDGTGVTKVQGGLKDAYALRLNSTALFVISVDHTAQTSTIVKVAK